MYVNQRQAMKHADGHTQPHADCNPHCLDKGHTGIWAAQTANLHCVATMRLETRQVGKMY